LNFFCEPRAFIAPDDGDAAAEARAAIPWISQAAIA